MGTSKSDSALLQSAGNGKKCSYLVQLLMRVRSASVRDLLPKRVRKLQLSDRASVSWLRHAVLASAKHNHSLVSKMAYTSMPPKSTTGPLICSCGQFAQSSCLQRGRRRQGAVAAAVSSNRADNGPVLRGVDSESATTFSDTIPGVPDANIIRPTLRNYEISLWGELFSWDFAQEVAICYGTAATANLTDCVARH